MLVLELQNAVISVQSANLLVHSNKIILLIFIPSSGYYIKMIWQDLVISTGTVVFIFALIPSILGKDKPAFPTSLMTGTVLVVFTVVYISLALWFAAVTTGITAILWYILAIQVLLRRRK